jgi:YggT family protein
MPLFFYNLIGFIDWILYAYMWVVIIAALLTWVNPDPYNPIVRVLRGLTEPIYRRIRRFVPTNFGGLDIAPLLLLLIILFFHSVVLPSLAGLASN